MSNIVTAQVQVTGIRSLFFDHFGEDAIPLTPNEKTGVAGNDPWEWLYGVQATTEGQLYILPTQVFACIRDGAKYIKKGRGSIQSLVVATLQVVDDVILLDRFLPPEALTFMLSKGRTGNPLEVLTRDPTQAVHLDVRKTKNPSTKAANVTYRVVAAQGWQISFGLEWDKTVVSRDQMQSALIEAGQLEGIGNGRKIGMGRFRISSFQVSELN